MVVVFSRPVTSNLCHPMDYSTPGLSVSYHLPKFAHVHAHCIGDAIQPSHPLTPSSPLPAIFPSIRDFSNESALRIRWPNYWSFSFSFSPSNECSGLIFLKIDCFHLLAVQGSLKSLLQHHSSKASILWALCLLCGLTLIIIHDHWEDRTLGYMDLCRQSDIFASQHTVIGLS